MSLTTKVAVPSRDDINTGLEPCHQQTMLELIGKPGPLSRNCSTVTNQVLKRMIVTESVGPFRATGHKIAILSAQHIFITVKSERPDLYEAVESEGMLCCRAVRGTKTSWSNHSWGLPLDMRIGTLDDYGSPRCSQGLLDLYPFFHAARWYWGAGFPRRDAMHFEPSDALVRWWFEKGMLV